MHGPMNIKPKNTLCAQCTVLTLEQVVHIYIYMGFSNYEAAKYLVEASRSRVVQRLCRVNAASYIEIFLTLRLLMSYIYIYIWSTYS